MHQLAKIKSVLVNKCFVFALNDQPTEQTNLKAKSQVNIKFTLFKQFTAINL